VGETIARYFIDRGWNRLGIATANDHRALMRRDGFEAAAGHPVPTVIVDAPSNLARGRQALVELLKQAPDLQAVHCSSDTLAHGVLIEAQARGLRVPEDLAICGFGDADFAAHTRPSLTTARVDGAGIGRLAAELIIARCRGEVVARPVVDVGFRVVERGSTATGATATTQAR
jgi:LacI family gluconate utilization system Gnt-I transcriptional repressor